MQWVTRERPKIDRIACPWLITRFIDPAAEFLFVPAAEVTGPGTTSTPRPSRRARWAVACAPDRAAASTTTVPRVRAAMNSSLVNHRIWAWVLM